MRLLLVLVAAVAVGCEGGGGGSACDPVDDAGNPSQCWARTEMAKARAEPGAHYSPTEAAVRPCQASSVIYLKNSGCNPAADELWSGFTSPEDRLCVLVPDGCKTGRCFDGGHGSLIACDTSSECPSGYSCQSF